MVSRCLPRFGLLSIMVTRYETTRGCPRKRMTTAHIVTGDPADDGTSDTSFGENGRGSGGANDERNGKGNFAEHAFSSDAVCC